MTYPRRALLKATASGAMLFAVAGRTHLLTPRQARAKEAAFRLLKDAEIRCLDAMGEALVPGSASAGLAHFVDAQLSCSFAESLLTVRYLDIAPPWEPFYRSALAATNKAAQARYGGAFHTLSSEQASKLVEAMANNAIPDWAGPPSALVLFVLRADAVDVRYGTMAGFDGLDIPYLAHIEPEDRW
ncbi:hypothetical protein JCM17845_11740 [Iodidimonas gelatinilytica]|uniref:Gluconate 2-dehydrogenase subunit 3 family protein n=1 Tax=Iodidimonas gelatinilytica TaxID=1236966 RepID=A0A5A7MWU3_9PROT|nr:gluconate 2-dehydrogenase subunit 3 family protein [Iodidimonas gelatinilytica]GER00551.1 hypothetical protein JCM17845_11740 [Iodidimonas gelatinilytica]